MGVAALIKVVGVILPLIVAVASVSIFILGSDSLPTGIEFFSSLPVAFGRFCVGITPQFFLL